MKLRISSACLLLEVLTTGCGQSTSPTASSSCSYQLSPTTQAVPISGGLYTATMMTTAACAWTATADAPWVSITGGSFGHRDRNVVYSVAANSDALRRSEITAQVSGQAKLTLTIIQDGSAPAP